MTPMQPTDDQIEKMTEIVSETYWRPLTQEELEDPNITSKVYAQRTARALWEYITSALAAAQPADAAPVMSVEKIMAEMDDAVASYEDWFSSTRPWLLRQLTSLAAAPNELKLGAHVRVLPGDLHKREGYIRSVQPKENYHRYLVDCGDGLTSWLPADRLELIPATPSERDADEGDA